VTEVSRSSEQADAQRRADVQLAVSRVLGEARTVDDAVPALLAALADALNWDYAALWLVADRHLLCADTWTIDDPEVAAFARASHSARFESGQGLPGRCWAERTAIWLASTHYDPALPRLSLARQAKLFGGLAFPIVNVDGVVGVVECFTREPETVTPELLRLAEALGRQIGQFLQRRAAEERLEENEARYAAIVNGALDAIIAIDEHGAIVEFNTAAEQMFGYPREDAVGREMAALIIPPSLRDAHRAGLERHRQSGRSPLLERRVELMACRRDGSEFAVELTITRMRVRGHWRFLGFIRDISERRQHEREREGLIAREREAHDEARSANALKDEFLAAVSHEMRTPLNAMLGWSDLLLKGTLEPERVRHIAAIIKRNAAVQHRLVEDMLDLSTFVSGRMRIAAEPVLIAEPVQAACDVVRPAADAKHVRLVAAIPPARVIGDKMRLQQVFWNLLTNAVKFTPMGGTVTTDGQVDGDQAVIHVMDTGCGIDPAFLPFVFDRFRQARDSRQLGGVGLGLAIVKQIVEAHGGTVTAHSDGIGRGARFTVSMPLESSPSVVSHEDRHD
jgi:two-component system, sensor histidine kinase and response regulator